MSSAVNAFVLVNTDLVHEREPLRLRGQRWQPATSALGRIVNPAGVGDSVNAGAHDCNCVGVGLVVVMPRSAGVNPSTVT